MLALAPGRTVLNAVGPGCERDRRRLVKGVSFRLRAGEMLRIIGHNGNGNGNGKSSRLRLRCRAK